MKVPLTKTATTQIKRFHKKRKTSIREEDVTTESPAKTLPPKAPAHHTYSEFTKDILSYHNPWKSAEAPSWYELATSFPLAWANSALQNHKYARTIQCLKPTWVDAQPHASISSTMRATWLGHASVYVQLPLNDSEDSIGILFDPMFSFRAGPTQYTGVARHNQSPCSVSDLPRVDIVAISHNHYDHCDLSTIFSLSQRFPLAVFCVPKGNKNWFVGVGIDDTQVIECDWWDEACIEPSTFDMPSHSALIRLTCVPAQHNSGRKYGDYNATLWCGWCVEQFVDVRVEKGRSRTVRHGSIYFAGHDDEEIPATAGFPIPKRSAQYSRRSVTDWTGPFDVSFVPIWRGGSLSFVSWTGLRVAHESMFSAFHCSPVDAVQIHLDVKSRCMIPIHFGTFVGSDLETLEAVIELQEACEKDSVDTVTILDIGQTVNVSVENILHLCN